MTKLKLIVLFPAILLPGVFSLQVQSQVTVGAGGKPIAGALLQLKERDVSNGDANSTKGLELSRVILTDKNQLYPMFQADNSGNYLIGNQVYAKAAEDAKHKGLMVYHTGNTVLPEGVYYWDGQEWTQAKGTGNVWYVENSSVAATTNSQSVYHQGNVSIGTASSNADLTVNGKLTVTDAPLLSNSSVLVLDSKGNVGTAVTIPAQMMFVQSKNIQEYSARSSYTTTFNQAVPFSVTWMQSDIQSNNIMTFNETADNTVFTFDKDGIYEVSGYLSYKAGAKIPTTQAEMSNSTSRVGLNVAIQLYLPGGIWQNMAAARHMVSGTLVGGSAITVVVPPVLSTFKSGDKIRMVFYRPDTNFGLPHGTDSDFGITDPTGIEFTKGMKVIAY